MSIKFLFAVPNSIGVRVIDSDADTKISDRLAINFVLNYVKYCLNPIFIIVSYGCGITAKSSSSMSLSSHTSVAYILYCVLSW